MAIGAYTLGILTVDHQVPFWTAFALSGVVCMVIGYFVGLVSLRLRGHYFSIFTLCGRLHHLPADREVGKLDARHRGPDRHPVPAAIGPLQFDSVLAQYYLMLAFPCWAPG